MSGAAVTPQFNPQSISYGFDRVAISGTVGKSSTAAMLSKLLETSGNEIAAWLSDGVYVNRTMRNDELHAWELATNAARAGEIDVLIQEIPSVLAGTIPADWFNVGIFTSICGSDDSCQRDRNSQRMQDLTASLALKLTSNASVVANADDPMIVEALAESVPSMFIYALNRQNPILRNHLSDGGNACWVDNGWIKVQHDGQRYRIIQTNELANSLQGRLSFQVQNTLAALSAAFIILGVKAAAIDHREFFEASRRTPRGGLRIIKSAFGSLIVDCPRSVQSIRSLVRGIRAYGPRRVIVAMTSTGALSSENIFEVSRIAGDLAGITILDEASVSADLQQSAIAGMLAADNPPVIVRRAGIASIANHIRAIASGDDVALVLTDDGDAFLQALPIAAE